MSQNIPIVFNSKFTCRSGWAPHWACPGLMESEAGQRHIQMGIESKRRIDKSRAHVMHPEWYKGGTADNKRIKRRPRLGGNLQRGIRRPSTRWKSKTPRKRKNIVSPCCGERMWDIMHDLIHLNSKLEIYVVWVCTIGFCATLQNRKNPAEPQLKLSDTNKNLSLTIFLLSFCPNVQKSIPGKMITYVTKIITKYLAVKIHCCK